MKEIVFDWLPGNTPPVTIDKKLEMPDYILSNLPICFQRLNIFQASKNYSKFFKPNIIHRFANEKLQQVNDLEIFN